MLRRHFLSSFSIAAGTGLALTALPARAISLEEAHPRLGLPLGGANLPKDVVDWDLLAEAGEKRFRDGQVSRFPAALQALDGKEVTLQGYMLPYRDAPAHREFLLGGLRIHCAGCLARDLNRIAAVKTRKPVDFTEMPLLLRGRLVLLEDEASPLFYRLENAKPV